MTRDVSSSWICRFTTAKRPCCPLHHSSTAVRMESKRTLFVSRFRRSIEQKMAQCSKNPLPRYEVQLRMGLLDSSKDQQDAFPKNVRANINGSVVVFPPLINLPPRPGQVQPVQKREPLPVDVSSQCLPICDSYQLNVDWQHEKTNYFVAVYVVKHLTTENLLDRVQKSGRVHYEETLRMVRKSLRTSGEDDIAMDSLKVSLLCPLSRLVMSVPSRSRDCVHLQCFDLHSLLMMNEKRPTWKCPVCNKSSPYSSLVIDRYFSNIIAKVNGAAKDIELLPNGDFKIAGVKERQYHNVQESTVQVQQTNKSVGKKSPAYSNSSTRSATNEQWTTRRSSTPQSLTHFEPLTSGYHHFG
ncbi:hypothetical protein M3Y94_00906500 [Aphelenchoides besseyi]|nr:hypothetical protein M3Y94_00906500 [Aphelenchoides besseyi]